MTETERLTFRGFLIGHKSMVESGVLVNSNDHVGADASIGPVERNSTILSPEDSRVALRQADEGIRPYVGRGRSLVRRMRIMRARYSDLSDQRPGACHG